MGSVGFAYRMAIVFVSILATVGVTACGGSSSPTAPTPPPTSPPTPAPPPQGTLTRGVYLLRLASLGASNGCSGGNPSPGSIGAVALEVQFQEEGPEWIGRLRTGRGDFQLTLRTNDDRTVTGTMRGRGLDDSFGGTQRTLDVTQPATLEAILIPGVPLVGRVNGELVYDGSSAGRVTCTSGVWTFERTGQL
jgi:hypothetical protein